jgi:hypothetical protein
MHFAPRALVLALAGAALAFACGGDTNNNPFSDGGGAAGPDGSAGSGGGSESGGTSAGGKGASGAAAGAQGGTGTGGTSPGTGGSAGATASGGSAGSSGAAGCLPPANKMQTAVCVTLLPETITPEPDPELDEKGVLAIQIFDTPNPPAKDASKVALAERIVPANPGTAEVALADVKTERLVATLPSVVYVRALFIDNPSLLEAGGRFGYGAWIGGFDVTDGFQDKEPVLPVKLTLGAANAIDLPLVALRKLTVNVRRSVQPVGDGEGPLTAVVVARQDPTMKPPPFGLAHEPCADLSGGGRVTLTGFVIGTGPYWAAAAMNDLGLTGEFPPGTLASLDVNGSKITIPQKLEYAATDYAPLVNLDLSYVVPYDLDAGPVPPNSCADIGVPDGGI